jgi:hypothetical protein
MVLRESGQRIELTDVPVWPWAFAATFIPFGLLLDAWAFGFVSSTQRAQGAARAWMILLGSFGAGLPLVMLRSMPRVRLVFDRDSRTMSLDQWALGRHARKEWPLESIAGIEVVRGVNLNMPGRWKSGFRLQVVMSDGRIIVPTPGWTVRQKSVQSAAATIASALGVSVTTTERWDMMGFPDKTLFNSDMGT